MAAERAPTRRKQCVFRRAFQRFPFGKCERKSRTNSSYDVLHKDSPHMVEKWSSADTPIATRSSSHTSPQEIMDSNICRTDLPAMESPQTSNGMFVEGGLVSSNSRFHGDHVSDMGSSSQDHLTRLQRAPSDSMQICVNTMGPQVLDSEYSSVSQPDEINSNMVSPPSPSVSSMETDVEVDPETGERALE